MFKKIKLYKKLLLEITETLCSVCLYLNVEGKRNHNPNVVFMRNHFEELKELSQELRKDI